MKAAKKRPRNAKPRKPAAKKPARKAATGRAAPKRPAAPRARRAVQRRLMIRFSDPTDADWLGAQGQRMGLGDAKGAGAATYARMLIRAARECAGAGRDPIDVLRGLAGRPPALRAPAPARAEPQFVEDQRPAAEDRSQPEGEPVDVDDLVNEVANKVQDDRGHLPQDQEIGDDGGPAGGVRVFGARRTRSPVDWSGR